MNHLNLLLVVSRAGSPAQTRCAFISGSKTSLNGRDLFSISVSLRFFIKKDFTAKFLSLSSKTLAFWKDGLLGNLQAALAG